jgi:hypothetical protein
VFNTYEGVKIMATKDRHIYGEVNSRAGMEKIFSEIRKDVDKAKSRSDLTELYKRAGYLITLTHAPSWEEKFGRKTTSIRKVGEEEFGKTARKINRKAKQLDVKPDYDETWGK